MLWSSVSSIFSLLLLASLASSTDADADAGVSAASERRSSDGWSWSLTNEDSLLTGLVGDADAALSDDPNRGEERELWHVWHPLRANHYVGGGKFGKSSKASKGSKSSPEYIVYVVQAGDSNNNDSGNNGDGDSSNHNSSNGDGADNDNDDNDNNQSINDDNNSGNNNGSYNSNDTNGNGDSVSNDDEDSNKPTLTPTTTRTDTDSDTPTENDMGSSIRPTMAPTAEESDSPTTTTDMPTIAPSADDEDKSDSPTATTNSPTATTTITNSPTITTTSSDIPTITTTASPDTLSTGPTTSIVTPPPRTNLRMQVYGLPDPPFTDIQVALFNERTARYMESFYNDATSPALQTDIASEVLGVVAIVEITQQEGTVTKRYSSQSSSSSLGKFIDTTNTKIKSMAMHENGIVNLADHDDLETTIVGRHREHIEDKSRRQLQENCTGGDGSLTFTATLEYRLTGEDVSYTLDEIIDEPFSTPDYRIYYLSFLGKDDFVGLSCTSAITFPDDAGGDTITGSPMMSRPSVAETVAPTIVPPPVVGETTSTPVVRTLAPVVGTLRPSLTTTPMVRSMAPVVGTLSPSIIVPSTKASVSISEPTDGPIRIFSRTTPTTPVVRSVAPVVGTLSPSIISTSTKPPASTSGQPITSSPSTTPPTQKSPVDGGDTTTSPVLTVTSISPSKSIIMNPPVSERGETATLSSAPIHTSTSIVEDVVTENEDFVDSASSAAMDMLTGRFAPVSTPVTGGTSNPMLDMIPRMIDSETKERQCSTTLQTLTREDIEELEVSFVYGVESMTDNLSFVGNLESLILDLVAKSMLRCADGEGDEEHSAVQLRSGGGTKMMEYVGVVKVGYPTQGQVTFMSKCDPGMNSFARGCAILSTKLLVTSIGMPVSKVHSDVLDVLSYALRDKSFVDFIPELSSISFLGPDPESLKLTVSASENAIKNAGSDMTTRTWVVSLSASCSMLLLLFVSM